MVLFLSGSPDDEQDEFFEETDKRSQVKALRGELKKKLSEKKFTKAYQILKVSILYVHTFNTWNWSRGTCNHFLKLFLVVLCALPGAI